MRLREQSPTWLIALATVAVTFAALAHVWVRLQMLTIGYDISRETKWRHDLGEQNQRLTPRAAHAHGSGGGRAGGARASSRWGRPIRG